MAFLMRVLFSTPFFVLVLILWVLMLLKSGVGAPISFSAQVAIAEDPFFNPIFEEGFHYVFWTWLSPFVAWFLGLNTARSLFWFYFAVSSCFYFLFAGFARCVLSEPSARLALLIFTAMPVSSTAYYWVCADSFTLLLMLLTLCFTRKRENASFSIPFFALLGGFLLGMQDFEKAAIASMLWATFNFYLEKNKAPHLLYSSSTAVLVLVGAVLGKFALMAIFSHYAIDVNSGRLYWLENNWHLALKYIYFNAPVSFYSALSAAWFFALVYIFKEKHGKILGVCLLACFAVLLIAMDHTRVFAILSFFLLAQAILLNASFLEKFAPRTVALFFVAYLLLPFVWVFRWPQLSLLPYNISILMYHLFGIELPVLNEVLSVAFVQWMAF